MEALWLLTILLYFSLERQNYTLSLWQTSPHRQIMLLPTSPGLLPKWLFFVCQPFDCTNKRSLLFQLSIPHKPMFPAWSSLVPYTRMHRLRQPICLLVPSVLGQWFPPSLDVTGRIISTLQKFSSSLSFLSSSHCCTLVLNGLFSEPAS